MIDLLQAALYYNNQEALQATATIIEFFVQKHLDKIPAEGSPEKLIPQNQKIRNGIYNALFLLANAEVSPHCQKELTDAISHLNGHHQAPVLNSENENALKSLKDTKINFKSQFLTEQYNLGNIIRLKQKPYIRILPSYELKGAENNDQKKHLNKISAALRKEGFKFLPSVDAYVKG